MGRVVKRYVHKQVKGAVFGKFSLLLLGDVPRFRLLCVASMKREMMFVLSMHCHLCEANMSRQPLDLWVQ